MELSKWTVSLLLALFMCLILTIYWLAKRNSSRMFTCPNPNCARCKIMYDFEQTRCTLKNKLSKLLRDRPETGAWLHRIHPMLSKPNNSHIWCLEGLETPPWINQNASRPEMAKLHHTLSSLFLTNENLQLLSLDYQSAVRDTEKWKINKTPRGKWKVFHLLDQGVWQTDRVVSCPNIVQLLGTITPQLMIGNLYGNVMLSVLEPSSSIEPHTGPCNFRIRCHIPIQPSSGFYIRVGTATRTWEWEKLLLFSDHHEHEVWHDVHATIKTATPSRVVLILDIWHPLITTEEKNILNQLFNELAT